MNFNQEQVKEIEKVFLSLEEEYIKQLIEMPEFYQMLLMYRAFSNEELLNIFRTCHERMENGLVEEKDEGKAELQMIASTLAMADKIKQLILTKNYSESKADGYARSR